LENPFKSELESFIKADVKLSTVIPPIDGCRCLVNQRFFMETSIEIQISRVFKHNGLVGKVGAELIVLSMGKGSILC